VLFDPIPLHTTYVPDSLHASSGTASHRGGIRWAGGALPGAPVTVTFRVTATASVPIVNTAVITDPYGTPTFLRAIVNSRPIVLPLVLRGHEP
jgi:hypothetical protein